MAQPSTFSFPLAQGVYAWVESAQSFGLIIPGVNALSYGKKVFSSLLGN